MTRSSKVAVGDLSGSRAVTQATGWYLAIIDRVNKIPGKSPPSSGWQGTQRGPGVAGDGV